MPSSLLDRNRYRVELVHDKDAPDYGSIPQMRVPSDLADLVRPHLENLAHEELWCIALDAGNRVIGCYLCSEGSATGTVLDVKRIFQQAILLNASAVALAHNHPSGT